MKGITIKSQRVIHEIKSLLILPSINWVIPKFTSRLWWMNDRTRYIPRWSFHSNHIKCFLRFWDLLEHRPCLCYIHWDRFLLGIAVHNSSRWRCHFSLNHRVAPRLSLFVHAFSLPKKNTTIRRLGFENDSWFISVAKFLFKSYTSGFVDGLPWQAQFVPDSTHVVCGNRIQGILSPNDICCDASDWTSCWRD